MHLVKTDCEESSAAVCDPPLFESTEPRRSRLLIQIGDAERAFERALEGLGLINRFPGRDGDTDLQKLLREYQKAHYRMQIFLENRLKAAMKDWERALASDALTDAETRASLIDALRKRGRQMEDPRLFTSMERELVECYRSLTVEDRQLFRLMLRRFGAGHATDAIGGAR